MTNKDCEVYQQMINDIKLCCKQVNHVSNNEIELLITMINQAMVDFETSRKLTDIATDIDFTKTFTGIIASIQIAKAKDSLINLLQVITEFRFYVKVLSTERFIVEHGNKTYTMYF